MQDHTTIGQKRSAFHDFLFNLEQLSIAEIFFFVLQHFLFSLVTFLELDQCLQLKRRDQNSYRFSSISEINHRTGIIFLGNVRLFRDLRVSKFRFDSLSSFLHSINLKWVSTTTLSVCKPTTKPQSHIGAAVLAHVAFVVGLQTNDVCRN